MDIVQRLWTNNKDLSAGIYVGADAEANLFFTYFLPVVCRGYMINRMHAIACILFMCESVYIQVHSALSIRKTYKIKLYMRVIINALVAVCAAIFPLAACAQTEKSVRFEEFGKHFIVYKDKTFDVGIFNTDIHGTADALSISSDSPFVPSLLPCDCREMDDIFWYKGSTVRLGDSITVAFMNRLCDDSHNNALSRYDHVVATYNAVGNLIDSRIVGRSGRAWSTELKGVVDDADGIVMTATRRDLPVPSMIEEETDLTFAVTTTRYTIGRDGLIARTSLGAPRSETVMASTMTATKENFATLLALFTPIKGDRITLSSFLHEGEEGKEIDHAYVRAFINPAPDCDCAPLRTLWTAGRKIETADRYILLMLKDCSEPRYGYPYAECVVGVFTKDGRNIDVYPVARIGDCWEAEITGHPTPFALDIWQKYTSSDGESSEAGIQKNSCSIDSDGFITIRSAGGSAAVSDTARP